MSGRVVSVMQTRAEGKELDVYANQHESHMLHIHNNI